MHYIRFVAYTISPLKLTGKPVGLIPYQWLNMVPIFILQVMENQSSQAEGQGEMAHSDVSDQDSDQTFDYMWERYADPDKGMYNIPRPQDSQSEFELLKEEHGELKQENVELRDENKSLREEVKMLKRSNATLLHTLSKEIIVVTKKQAVLVTKLDQCLKKVMSSMYSELYRLGQQLSSAQYGRLTSKVRRRKLLTQYSIWCMVVI